MKYRLNITQKYEMKQLRKFYKANCLSFFHFRHNPRKLCIN